MLYNFFMLIYVQTFFLGTAHNVKYDQFLETLLHLSHIHGIM